MINPGIQVNVHSTRRLPDFNSLLNNIPDPQAVREFNFDLLPGEHKVRPYDRPVRGMVVMEQAKVGARSSFCIRPSLYEIFYSRTACPYLIPLSTPCFSTDISFENILVFLSIILYINNKE
jgi:hypothetical protein